MKVTIYPHSITKGDIRMNPYISDFIQTLRQNGMTIANPPHKNPLFSLIPQKTDSDAYIFHWLENVPDYKYGALQTLAAIWLLLKIKLHKKRVIWFLHNKRPHTMKHQWAKKVLIHLLLRKADLIITHATEGVEVIRDLYPKAVSKTEFLHHPTKNRMEGYVPQQTETDLLIWGNISRYKGVPEFVRFATQHSLKLKTKIIGKCSSKELLEELRTECNDWISIEDRSIPFDELRQEIRKSRFVLIPYAAESILSSGILMDSLSFGAQVIGPNVGSFRDYAADPLLNVYTFHTFEEIPELVNKANKEINIADYNRFLDAHSWKEFGKEFQNLLQKIIP